MVLHAIAILSVKIQKFMRSFNCNWVTFCENCGKTMPEYCSQKLSLCLLFDSKHSISSLEITSLCQEYTCTILNNWSILGLGEENNHDFLGDSCLLVVQVTYCVAYRKYRKYIQSHSHGAIRFETQCMSIQLIEDCSYMQCWDKQLLF